MFAILFHENLTPFYNTISSFPTALWTVLLLLLLIYWLVAMLGVVDMDALDFDISDGLDSLDGLDAGDISVDTNASGLGFLTAIMIRFGLHGVPFAIILSILTVVGWLLSYYANYVLNGIFPDGLLHYAVGLAILLVSFVLAAWVTGIAIKPLRKWAAKIPQRTAKTMLGKVATVRTSVVNESFGEAILEDGGAGLILKVRAIDTEFKMGDKVVLLEYMANENVYRVVSEAEFNYG